jgi:hypothetical protein
MPALSAKRVNALQIVASFLFRHVNAKGGTLLGFHLVATRGTAAALRAASGAVATAVRIQTHG